MENGNKPERNDGKVRSFKERLVAALPLLVFLLVMAALTVIFWPEIAKLGTEKGQAEFSELVRESGFFGWIIALGVQLLQIFLAFIPGEPVEILLGVLFGPWLGTFTCLFGIFLGTLAIYFLVRKFGIGFVKRAVGDKDIRKYKFFW